ncbi:MAG: hypothetical protein HY907_09735 [Deltaproteobacteria bacterium]|nr:hypothetical protein [Deltaproteobacteria bacterium]
MRYDGFGRIAVLGVLLALGAGCEKKKASAAPDRDTLQYLPPGAAVYAVIDVQAALGNSGELKELVLGLVPAACSDAARDAKRAVVALYGKEFNSVVAIVQGVSPEALFGCLEKGLKLAAGLPEARDGLEVVSFASPEGDGRALAVFSASATTQVLVVGEVLDAVLRAAAGGPSLAGASILDTLSRVPSAPVVAALQLSGTGAEDLWRELAEELADTLPMPSGAALSIDIGGSGGITGALVMSDAAAARTMQQTIRAALAKAREAIAREAEDPSAMAMMGMGVNLLDAVSVEASGAVVRVSLAGGSFPGGVGALGMMSAIAIPTYMKFVRSAKAEEARLNLGKLASLLERYADARITGGQGGQAFPSNSRVAGDHCDAPNCNAECVPRSADDVSGRKYQPTDSDWMCSATGPNCTPETAWAEIPFAITQPIGFQYCYSVKGGVNEMTFELAAFGDADGDGVWSSYRRQGMLLCSGAAGCLPTIGAIVVTNEGE